MGLAIENRNFDIAEELLKGGADVNEMNAEGESLLQQTINQNNHEWPDDQQSDHRDNLLGDGANRRGSCQCGDDGYHDQHSTRGDFKT